MAWPTSPRPANALLGFWSALNAAAPNRKTTSDGMLGDPAHAARDSDHNPNSRNVVTALDATDDPARGADMGAIAERLRIGRDPRIKMVIFDRQIFTGYATSYRPAWWWVPYYGPNAHITHLHLSLANNPVLYDSTAPWDIGVPTTLEDDVFLPMKYGDGMPGPKFAKRSDVAYVQGLLNRTFGAGLVTDGQYGDSTAAAVKKHLWPTSTGKSLDGNRFDDLMTAFIKVVAK